MASDPRPSCERTWVELPDNDQLDTLIHKSQEALVILECHDGLLKTLRLSYLDMLSEHNLSGEVFSEHFPSTLAEPHGRSSDTFMGAQSSSGVWTRFKEATRCFKGLLHYQEAYQWYISKASEHMINEQIMYAGLRPMLSDQCIGEASKGKFSNAHDVDDCRTSVLHSLLPSLRCHEDPELLHTSGTRSKGHPIEGRKAYPSRFNVALEVNNNPRTDVEVENGYESRWDSAKKGFKALCLHISAAIRHLSYAPRYMLLSGAILCLSGKAYALDDSSNATQHGCWDTFLQYLVATGAVGGVLHQCLFEEGLPYVMGALSFSWPIIKTDSRSPIALIYGVYLAHLATTAAYSYVCFRDHHEPRRSFFLSILLCGAISLLILFWSPTGMESLLTFLPPVLSLSVFTLANVSLIGNMLRSLVGWFCHHLCSITRYCLDYLGGGIQSIGQSLRLPASGREGDEENLVLVASA